MSLALLFPGQGTQHPGMLSWLDAEPGAAPVLAAMAARIGADWRQRLDDPHWAADNRVAQLLITGLGLAAWSCLAPRLPAPTVVAGYSVGELPAFCAAGVYGVDDALALAHDRAAAMTKAVAGSDTGLLAVSGADGVAVETACRRHDVQVAIELAADRVVIGGAVAALDNAAAELAAGGANCKRLAVALASHTRWMADAVPVFADRLRSLPFARPRPTLVCNLDGAAIRRPDELQAALSGQIAQTVRWSRCIESVAERLPRCVLEVGPGGTLSAMWNDRIADVPARSIDEFRSADAVVAWVDSTLRRG